MVQRWEETLRSIVSLTPARNFYGQTLSERASSFVSDALTHFSNVNWISAAEMPNSDVIAGVLMAPLTDHSFKFK